MDFTPDYSGLCPQAWMIFFQYSARTSWVHWSIVFSPPLKKSIVFLKYALKMDLVKGEWFDLYALPKHDYLKSKRKIIRRIVLP